jgi:hypothetical protein
METANELEAQRKLLIKMAVSSWDTQYARITKLLDSLTDDQLLSATAPGRNRGIYLIGHLVAVSDSMRSMMGWGDKLYPQLEKIFIKDPDSPGAPMPPAPEIRKYWTAVHEEVTRRISQMAPADWLARHSAVSEEDFVKEPHRNKLNLLISRTNHQSYHLGQLIYLVNT